MRRLIAVMVLVGVAVAPGGASGAAESSGYCAQDPTHDHVIDTGDIGTFTNHFGQPYLELDFAPVPLGDGYVDTSEIGGVTALFGQTCLGIWSGSAATPENMARLSQVDGVPTDYPEIWGCAYNLWFPGYYVYNGWAHLTNWGGGAGCMHGSGFYTINCEIQVRQLQSDGSWLIQAGLGTTNSAEGTVCQGNNSTWHSLRCNLQTAGWYFHDIYWAPQQGQELPWHAEEHWMLSNFEEVFIPCFS